MNKLILALCLILLPTSLWAGGVMIVGGGAEAAAGGPSALYTAATAIWDFENNANDTKGVKTLTAVGTPTYGTTTPPQGTYYTILNGSTQWFTRAADADFDMADSHYSMSFWVYSTDTWELHIADKNQDTSAGWKVIGSNGAGIITIQHEATFVDFSGVVPASTWIHVCFKYDQAANLITYWISTTSFGNVSNAATVAMATTPTNDATALLYVGAKYAGVDQLTGLLDEFVIWKGYRISATDAANLYAHTWR